MELEERLRPRLYFGAFPLCHPIISRLCARLNKSKEEIIKWNSKKD